MSGCVVGRARADGGVFGDVLIERAEARVVTWLESDMPRVFTLERRGQRTRRNVPIGTRDENFLTADLAGEPVAIHPGSGRIVKRTYRIVVEYRSRTVSFGPKDLTTCRFIDGKPQEIERQVCSLTAYTDGSVGIEWALPTRIAVLKRTVIPPEPIGDDVLIACGVAAAFGTGSLSLSSIVMELVSSVFPT